MGVSRLGDQTLTRRQTEVLAALADRLTNAEIAARLYVSERTVESHVTSLLRKFHARNRFELGALATDVLADPADTDRRLPAALELLADPATYCGRDDARARLHGLWRRTTAGQTLVAVVAGEAGIGKSRLVAEFAGDVYRDGARVLLGSCFEDVQVPYGPLVQIVADDVAGLSDAELRRRAGSSAAGLARIVPAVAHRLRTPAVADAVDPAMARAAVFEALRSYVSRAAELGPILMIVEDAHWATPTTLGALRHLARLGGRAPVLAVVTTRHQPPDLQPALSVFLADLARLPAVEQIELGGLAEHDVAALLQQLGSDVDPAGVIAMTGGNPLFVREVAAMQAGQGARSLLSLLARRYTRLHDDDLAVVDLAAVLGSEFDADVLAAAAERPVGDVLDSLEHAEAAGLLAASPDRSGRFSFVPALFRTVRYDEIPAGRRLRLHRAAARALGRRSVDDRVLADLARHACIAAPLGDARLALEYAVRAGVRAEQSLALDEAADNYRRALEVADALVPPDPAVRLGLTIRLGEVLQGTGDADARRVLVDAAATARSLGDADALAKVGWAIVRYGSPRTPGGRDAELAAVLEDAIRGIGPEPTAARARTLAAFSEDLCFTDPVRAWKLVDEASDIARHLQDQVTLGHVLVSYRFSARTPENAQARQPTSDELIAIGEATGDVTFTVVGLANRAWSFRELGDLAASDDAIGASAALLQDRTLPPAYMAAYALFRSTRAALAGDLVLAEQEAQAVWALAGRAFDPGHWYGPALLMIRHHQGRLAELVAVAELAAAQAGIGDTYQAALAAAYAHAGRHADARAIVRSFARDQFAGLPRNMMWLAGMAGLCEAAEMTGDDAAAEELRVQLAPFSGRIADLPQAAVAPVDLALSQAALTAGDAELAEGFAAQAVAASRKRHTPLFLGRELVRLAAARRARGVPAATVRPLVDEALGIAHATGAHLIRCEAERYRLA